jgi:hypothetical protein
VNLQARHTYGRRLILLCMLPLLAGSCRDDGRGGETVPALASKPISTESVTNLPIAGTQVPLLPPGKDRDLAQTHCLACHASDIILQQRLTETQWRAAVDKMQRWGAEIRDEDKAALVMYLVAHFGPDNDRFTPIVARPQNRVLHDE